MNLAHPPSFAFSQGEHLKSKAEFDRVIKAQQHLHCGDCRLSKATSLDGVSRLGFIVGRKVGCSPTRNRWKRLWKEAFRLERPYFKVGMDVVVQIRPKAKMLEISALRLALQTLAQK